MTSQQRQRLVDLLQMMACRPALLIGDHDPNRAELWLNGFSTAIDVQEGNSEEIRCIRHEVLTSRGWKVRATNSLVQMLDSN
jgi:hypothetical protein